MLIESPSSLNIKSQPDEERVWEIRDFIQELEDIKDGIVNFLISRKKLDDVTKNLWISDVKEFYYNTVAAWQIHK